MWFFNSSGKCLHFGYYVIYKGEKGLYTNVWLGLYSVQHFPDEPDAQHLALGLSLPLTVPQFFSALLNKQSNCSSLSFVFNNWIRVLASSKAETIFQCLLQKNSVQGFSRLKKRTTTNATINSGFSKSRLYSAALVLTSEELTISILHITGWIDCYWMNWLLLDELIVTGWIDCCWMNWLLLDELIVTGWIDWFRSDTSILSSQSTPWSSSLIKSLLSVKDLRIFFRFCNAHKKQVIWPTDAIKVELAEYFWNFLLQPN